MRWDETYVLFSAFLGQPIVPVGHHQDCAEDYGLLEKLADLINSTGAVEWMDMKSMARSNFVTRRDGKILDVKMYARTIDLKVPEGIESVRVARPWLEGQAREELTVSDTLPGSGIRIAPDDKVIPVEAGDELKISSVSPDAIDHLEVRLRPTPLWAYTRRHLCEGRDRLTPFLDRLRPRHNGVA